VGLSVGGVKTKYHPSAKFANWTSKNLRQDLLLMDIDLCLRDRQGNFMLLEIKARSSNVSIQQRGTLSLLNAALNLINGKVVRLFLRKCLYVPTVVRWHGVHLLQFEKDEGDFSGKVWIDGKEVTEEEVIAFLNFESNLTR